MTEVLFMGLGVLINAAAVVIGTLIGVMLRNVLKERVTDVIMQGLGITVLGAGILDLADGTAKLSANGFKWGVLFIVLAVVLGGVTGSLIHLQDGLDRLGGFLQRKLSKDENSTLGKAFVNATLITCVGAMVVYGSIRSRLGDNDTLYLKSVMDAFVCMALAVRYGFGVALSAIPMLIIQGAFALCGGLLSNYIIGTNFEYLLTAVGGTLVMCVGINILEIKEIRTADLVPAIAFCLFVYLF